MFGAILKATNNSFQKGMIFCRSTYVKKVMKLLAFIFEQPSYVSIYLSTRIIWKVLSMASQLHNALIKCYQIIHFWKLEFNDYLMV